MGALLHALHAHQPLPADFRWPQVKPMSAGASRPRWPAGVPGMGDEATWGPCDGHPNDPRTEEPQHGGTVAALDDVASLVRQARAEVAETDDWTERAAGLVREAIEALQALEVEP